jgi:hypothetical protein
MSIAGPWMNMHEHEMIDIVASPLSLFINTLVATSAPASCLHSIEERLPEESSIGGA